MKNPTKIQQKLIDKVSIILQQDLEAQLTTIDNFNKGIIIKGYVWNIKKILDEFGEKKVYMNPDGIVILQ